VATNYTLTKPDNVKHQRMRAINTTRYSHGATPTVGVKPVSHVIYACL